MKADLTRTSFDPRKHFARVLMQQGRVQLDADWNDQVAILLHSIRTLAADLIGPAGGPAGACGFLIFLLPPRVEALPILNDFVIGLGRYYVDGILCEADGETISFKLAPQPAPTAGTTSPTSLPGGVIQLDTWTLDGLEFARDQYLSVSDDVPPDQAPAFPPTIVQIVDLDPAKSQLTLRLPPGFTGGTPTNPRLRRVITYLTQPDYPAPPLPASGELQLYLDVWERHLTFVEDDSMREVALGGPDTATRSKVVWQLKAMPLTQNVQGTAGSPCIPIPELTRLLNPRTRGRLKARAKQATASTDPCIIPPSSSYAGPENQLYRVEIHRAGPAWNGADAQAGGAAAATFKWSRENGSVIFPIVSGGGSNLLVLASLGRDDRFSLASGDWVEVEDDRSVLLNAPGPLLQVQSIDRASATVTLTGTPDATLGSTSSAHPLLRRWDQKLGNPSEAGLTLGADNAALLREGVWLALEDGIEIFFNPSQDTPNAYRTADYWLIPARTATGDVEWPRLTDPAGNLVLDKDGSTVPLARDPDGVSHHFAPIGTATIVAGQQLVVRNCLECFQPVHPSIGN